MERKNLSKVWPVHHEQVQALMADCRRDCHQRLSAVVQLTSVQNLSLYLCHLVVVGFYPLLEHLLYSSWQPELLHEMRDSALANYS